MVTHERVMDQHAMTVEDSSGTTDRHASTVSTKAQTPAHSASANVA